MIATTNRTIEWLIWGAILLLFATDRVFKYFFVGSEKFSQKDYVNEFIAFGIPMPFYLVVLATILILLWLIKEARSAFKKNENVLGYLIIGVIVGGVSNAIDRMLYGGVIDYLNIIPRFPIFNLADVLITFSVLGIVLLLTKRQSRTHGH